MGKEPAKQALIKHFIMYLVCTNFYYKLIGNLLGILRDFKLYNYPYYLARLEKVSYFTF